MKRGYETVIVPAHLSKRVDEFSVELADKIQNHLFNDNRNAGRSLSAVRDDIFLGKMAEWAVWKLFEDRGVKVRRPDMDIYGSECKDFGDIRVIGKRDGGRNPDVIAIKASKPGAKFLMVHDGVYDQMDTAVFCTVDFDLVKVFGFAKKRHMRRYILRGDWVVDRNGNKLFQAQANNRLVRLDELLPIGDLISMYV